MTDAIDLSKAEPLSEWKTRDGRKAVFGCWNPEHADTFPCIGWLSEGACAEWRINGRYYNEDDGDSEYDIVSPWPKEPVTFETEIVSTSSDMKANYEGTLGYRYYKELTPFIGKRVKVTVEELP